jgi:hypothetical protein
MYTTGDLLLSGAASSVLVWKEKIPREEWEEQDDDDEGRRHPPHIPEDQR